MNRPRIFVSYSRKDRDFTQRLVSDLHTAGAEVWVDVEGITAGNFMRAIDEAMAKCEWMVLVLTPSALASEYVKQETYTALHRVAQGHMRAVIPVLAVRCKPDTIPPQWDVLQRYDATRDYEAALAGMLWAVGLSPEADAASAPTPALPLFEESAGDLTTYNRFRLRLAQPAWVAVTWLTPDNAASWFFRGHSLALLKRYTKALAAIDRALALDPQYVPAWTNKIAVLCELQRYAEALIASDQALALDPTFAYTWNNMGNALWGLNRYEDAVGAYDRVLALDPKYAVAWRNKAISLRALNREADAQDAERRASDLGG